MITPKVILNMESPLLNKDIFPNNQTQYFIIIGDYDD